MYDEWVEDGLEMNYEADDTIHAKAEGSPGAEIDLCYKFKKATWMKKDIDVSVLQDGA